MASLRDIKIRINSIENISKITKAMKMVSAVKLKRSQEIVNKCRLYVKKIQEILESIAISVRPEELENTPILRKHPYENKTRIIVITADRGLCGSFNNNITKKASQLIRDYKKKHVDVEIINIGKKGYKVLNKLSLRKFKDIKNAWSLDILKLSQDISQEFSKDYIYRRINSLNIIGTYYKTPAVQVVEVHKLLPIGHQSTGGYKNIDYIYEPSPKDLLKEIVPEYLMMFLYQSFLESSVSEHSARMQAMDSATKNSQETFNTLTLQYNRLRQSNITKELIEIISGAEALK